MYRVTPDVQALVQAAISSRGAAGALIASWQRGETVLIACEEIISEYENVLRRSHIQKRFVHITDHTITTSADVLRKRAVLVTTTEVPPVISEDPDDDVVLACAVAGNAEYIVSRDRHLSALGTYQGIPIVSTEAFAAILRGQVSEPLALVYGRA